MVRLGGVGLAVPCFAFVALVAVPSAWGLAEVAGGRINVRGTASITFDSNIYANIDEVSDTVYRLRPSVSFLKDSGLLRLDSELYLQAVRYDTYSDEDTEDYGLDLRLSFPQQEDAQLELQGEVHFMHLTAPNPEIGDIIESDRATLRGSLLTKTSEKLRSRLELSYDARDYDRFDYRDSAITMVDGSLLYALSPRVRLFGGAGYTNFDIDATESASGSSTRLFAGAQGDFTPKLTGSFRLGYTTRRFDDGDDFSDRGAVVMGSDLAWRMSEKTTFLLQGSRYFDVTPTNVSYLATNLTLRARHSFTEKLSAEASLTYIHGTFTASREEDDPHANRSDDDFRLGLGVAYRFNRHLSGRIDLAASTRESTSDLFENDRTTLAFSLTGRF